MDMQTASSRMQGFLTLFDYQTKFFPRVLEGISPEDMQNRLNTPANHPAWLAGSLIHQRFLMASEMPHNLKQTGAELYANHQGIQDGVQYPSLSDYLRDWERITPEARKALVLIDDQKLESTMDMGAMKMTYYEVISFSMYREASIIGQLALWRRLLGYPAMKYD